MTPDAAGIVAQVDAALLIALMVDERVSDKRLKNQNFVSANLPWLYLVGSYAVFLSLGVAVASVIASKDLIRFPAYIAVDGMVAGFLPLMFSTYVRIVPEIGPRQMRFLLVGIGALLIWFLIWWSTYIPFNY